MSQQERLNWDERFRAADHADTAPDPFLAKIEQYVQLLRPSSSGQPLRALDLACGAGRHSVYLAERGWEVTGCDISLEGLRRAKAVAAERGLRLSLYCQDLETLWLPAGFFDLVAVFFYLQRDLFAQIQRTLRPLGLVVYKTYTVDQSQFPGRPSHPMHLLQQQELLEAFRDFRVLCYEEIVEGRGVAQIIAQKTPRSPAEGPEAPLK